MRDQMMATTEKVAGEKMEKRRALGRGLESLLPGARGVNPAAGGTAPGQSGGAAGQQQVPHFVRNDKTLPDKTLSDGATASNEATAGVRFDGVIQAVAEDAVNEAGPQHSADSLPQSPLLAKDARNGAPGFPSDPVGVPEPGITIFAQAESRMPGNLVVNIELAAIDKNPYQTRYEFDEEKLEELMESIRAQGVVQPVVVRPAEEEGRYILIVGERRCRASRMAGKTMVPAIVKRVSEQQAAEMTIIENLQREDLNCIEQAEAFRVLSKEFSLTQAQIGQRVGMSRESVSNYMRLLKLPQEMMEHLIAGRLSFSEARELLKLEDVDIILQAGQRVVKEQMKFEQVEAMVMRMTGLLAPLPGDQLPGQERKKSGARWVDPNVRSAQTDLERMLGVRVRIRDRKGKGKIVIEYHTVDDYQRVVEMLRGKGSS
ncbi:MAG TPA: ParB/RepB/Spo0J family partition protein [Candidatus Sulfotelmatobacter sp.]|jgi:ParB family chromosome partitioning protein